MSLFLSETERVWTRLKAAASDAAQKHAKISPANASLIVETIIADEHAYNIPREARVYFAKELQDLARDGKS